MAVKLAAVVVVAVLCAVSVSAGAWLLHPSAGLILAGVQGYGGLYAAVYVYIRLRAN